MAAARALARGLDTPGLRDLAGLGADEPHQIGDLVPVVADELGVTVPDHDTVVWARLRDLAGRMLHGSLPVRDGLSAMAAWTPRVRFGKPNGCRCADRVEWALDWQGLFATEQEADAEALTVATDILTGHGPGMTCRDAGRMGR